MTKGSFLGEISNNKTERVIFHHNSSCFVSFTALPFFCGWSVQQDDDLDPGVYTQVDQSQFQMCQWNWCCQLPVTAWVEQPQSSSQNHCCLLSGNRSSHMPETLCQSLSAHIHYVYYVIIISIITIVRQSHAQSPVWHNWPLDKSCAHFMSCCTMYHVTLYFTMSCIHISFIVFPYMRMMFLACSVLVVYHKSRCYTLVSAPIFHTSCSLLAWGHLPLLWLVSRKVHLPTKTPWFCGQQGMKNKRTCWPTHAHKQQVILIYRSGWKQVEMFL